MKHARVGTLASALLLLLVSSLPTPTAVSLHQPSALSGTSSPSAVLSESRRIILCVILGTPPRSIHGGRMQSSFVPTRHQRPLAPAGCHNAPPSLMVGAIPRVPAMRGGSGDEVGLAVRLELASSADEAAHVLLASGFAEVLPAHPPAFRSLRRREQRAMCGKPVLPAFAPPSAARGQRRSKPFDVR
ncbi:hypothetical protein T484DRAFT_1746988 [Baffinella frigidus]|nr:hypothetical protein T484DRAFT_1746988 [Cryptophyta sp. CCMP2293]